MGSFDSALASFESAAADVGRNFHGGCYDTLNATARQASGLMGAFSSFCAKGMAEAESHAQALKTLFPKGLDGLDEEMRNFEREIGWNDRTGTFSPARYSKMPPPANPCPPRKEFSPIPPKTPSRPAPPHSDRIPPSRTPTLPPPPAVPPANRHSPPKPFFPMPTHQPPSPSVPPVADAASKALGEKYRRVWDDAYHKQLYPALQTCGEVFALRGQIGQKLDELARIVAELNHLSMASVDRGSIERKMREMDSIEKQIRAQARLLDERCGLLANNDGWLASARSNLEAVQAALSPAAFGGKDIPAWGVKRRKVVEGFRERLARVSRRRTDLERRLKELKATCSRLCLSIASQKQRFAAALAAENVRKSRLAAGEARGSDLCQSAKNAYCQFISRIKDRTALRFAFGKVGARYTASPAKGDFLHELANLEAARVSQIEVAAKALFGLQKRVEALSPADLNATDTFPSCMIVDAFRVSIAGHMMEVPIPSRFPFDRPRCFKNSSEIEPFLLRLLCALPVGSVQITLLDIEKKGDNGRLFNSLAKAGHGVFRLVTDIAELHGVLKEHGSYIASLASSGKFTATIGDWATYNASHPRNPLPCRILAVHSLHGWDERDVDDLADLFVRGPASGVHVFYTLDGMEMLDDRVRAKVKSWASKAASTPVDLAKWASSAAVLHPMRVPLRLPAPAQVERILDAYVDLLAKRASRSAHVFKDLFEGVPLWSASSIAGLEAPVGWDESGDSVNIRIGDDKAHALVGGISGSGKTNLIHIILCSLCHRYSPEELQICLLDMKDGVEAFRYLDSSRKAWLPHAKAILASQSPHFASKYLEAMVAEMRHRNDTFKRDGSAKIGEWRKKTGKKMPRILFVADEFTHMFDDSDLAKTASANLLELLQLGRSCGIHILLATQDTNALTTSNAGVILSQTPLRFALPDAPGVLATGNRADKAIRKPQCILNEARGEDGMNRLFVHPFFDNENKTPGDVDLFRKTMEAAKGHWRGGAMSVCKVVDSVSLSPVPPFPEFKKMLGPEPTGGRPCIKLLLGRADDFDGAPFTMRLYGDAYRDNLLVVSENDPTGRSGVWDGLRKSIVWSLFCLADKQVLFYAPQREKPFEAKGFTVLDRNASSENVLESLISLRDSLARHRILVVEDFDQAVHVFNRGNSPSYGEPDPDTPLGLLYATFSTQKKAFTVILFARDFIAAEETLGDAGLKAMAHRIAFGYGRADSLRPIIKGTDMLENPGESIFYSGPGVRGGYTTILPFVQPRTP